MSGSSNLSCWQEMQERDYFERHRCYRDKEPGPDDLVMIGQFFDLRQDHKVVVIGCGYGRGLRTLCDRVAAVYGIDVSHKILDKADAYVGKDNFIPVLAENYKSAIPAVDLVYSIVTFQHLTRDLVGDYVSHFRGVPMVLQFLEATLGEADAKIKVYEPCVSWTREEIQELGAKEIRSFDICRGVKWHWALL